MVSPIMVTSESVRLTWKVMMSCDASAPPAIQTSWGRGKWRVPSMKQTG